MPPYIRQIAVGPMANFVYLLGAADSEEAVLIDASWEPERILAAAQEDNKRLSAVVLTHAHYDHTQALPELLAQLHIPVFLQQTELAFVRAWDDTHASPAPYCPRFCALLNNSPEAFSPLKPDDALTLAGLHMHMLATPGHTVGGQCVWVEGQGGADGALFTGDTLFAGACGRVDLPGGNMQALYESLHLKLHALPDNTTVFPGHDYGDSPTSSLAHERRTNPYLKDKASFFSLRAG